VSFLFGGHCFDAYRDRGTRAEFLKNGSDICVLRLDLSVLRFISFPPLSMRLFFFRDVIRSRIKTNQEHLLFRVDMKRHHIKYAHFAKSATSFLTELSTFSSQPESVLQLGLEMFAGTWLTVDHLNMDL